MKIEDGKVRRGDGLVACKCTEQFHQGSTHHSPHDYTPDNPLWLSRMALRGLARRGVVRAFTPREMGFVDGDKGESSKPGPSRTKLDGPSEDKASNVSGVSLADVGRAEDALESDHGTEIRSVLADVSDDPAPAKKAECKAALREWLESARRVLKG